jgi:hypothetical protein
MDEPWRVCDKKGYVKCKPCNGGGIRFEKACEICKGTGMLACPACRGIG